MARYLLNAPDEDMERWKADARECGVPFSRWLRDAAERSVAVAKSEPAQPAPEVKVVAQKPISKRSPGSVVPLEHRKVNPDWKR